MPFPISEARISISPELPFNWKSLTKAPFKLNTESVAVSTPGASSKRIDVLSEKGLGTFC